jgi:hypothetical protein
MNLIISEIRNKMQTAMLNAILQIRAGLKRLNKCFFDLEITEDMVKYIEPSSIYEKEDANPDEQNHDTDTHNDFETLNLKFYVCQRQ